MKRVRLVDVYGTQGAEHVLYRLLQEREKRVNISHKKMPSLRQHLAFVRSRPYRAWYLISTGSGEYAGGIYLSRMSEIGVFVFKKFRQNGYGRKAVGLLMKKHTGVRKFLANVNPTNERSIRFFRELGFKHIQNTYELNYHREEPKAAKQ